MRWLYKLGLLVLLVPVLVIQDLVCKYRVSRLEHGVVSWGHGDLALADDALVIRSAGVTSTIPLSELAHVEVTHVTGDSGFADGNTLYYFVAIRPHAGPSRGIWLCEGHPYPLEKALFEPLRAAGLSSVVAVIDGPLKGLSSSILWCAAVVWFVLAGLIVRALL